MDFHDTHLINNDNRMNCPTSFFYFPPPPPPFIFLSLLPVRHLRRLSACRWWRAWNNYITDPRVFLMKLRNKKIFLNFIFMLRCKFLPFIIRERIRVFIFEIRILKDYYFEEVWETLFRYCFSFFNCPVTVIFQDVYWCDIICARFIIGVKVTLLSFTKYYSIIFFIKIFNQRWIKESSNSSIFKRKKKGKKNISKRYELWCWIRTNGKEENIGTRL